MAAGTARHPLLDPRVLLRGLILIATLLAVGAILEKLNLRAMLGTGWIDSQVRGHGAAGIALLLAVGTLFTALGLPRQVLCFLAGYALGFLDGAVLAMAATLLGAAIGFHYARFMGRAVLLRHFPHRIRKIDDFLAENTLVTTLILRLAPFTNNLATTLAAGVSGVRAGPFFAGSTLGYLPQTLVFALLGSGIGVDPQIRIGLGVALFLASTVLGVWLWRRARSRRGLPDALDTELEAEAPDGKTGDRAG
jgi:uncharacterized membrane protein YdjX (TVP38/TMEM64 family)